VGPGFLVPRHPQHPQGLRLEHRVSVKRLPRQLKDPLYRDGVANWEDDVGRQFNANSRRLHLAASKRSDELSDLAIGKAEAELAQRLTLKPSGPNARILLLVKF
jgi:hypothetical protein